METFAPKGKVNGPIMPEFILKRSLSLGAKITYALLCDYAAMKHHCWPSHGTLAAWLSRAAPWGGYWAAAFFPLA
jgi:hypothetical protein